MWPSMKPNGEVAIEWRVDCHVAQEFLPTDPIGIGERPARRDLLPIGPIVDVRIRLEAKARDRRRRPPGLNAATMQRCDRGTIDAVDLEYEQVVPPDTRCPGAQNGSEHAALELEQR